MAQKEEEFLDVVDEHDNVIDVKLRDEVHQNNYLFRAVCGFIKNSAGKLWIPRRTAHKKLYPLSLDMSVAGHVESGETYENAFARELKEELNLEIGSVEISVLGRVKPSEGFIAFCQVWEIQLNETPFYNTDDFIESYWLLPQELLSKLEGGEPAKSDLRPLIHYFYTGARSSAG